MDKIFNENFRQRIENLNLDVDEANKQISDMVKEVAMKVIGEKKKSKQRKKLSRDIVDTIKQRKQAKTIYAKAMTDGDNADRITETWNEYVE